MKKPKLLIVTNHDSRTKIYVNHKWYKKDVSNASLRAFPGGFNLEMELYSRDSRGCLNVEYTGNGPEIVTVKKNFYCYS